ncbi:MAG: hypothetical protein ACYC9L_03030 [Sulfuricaulis sp.]
MRNFAGADSLVPNNRTQQDLTDAIVDLFARLARADLSGAGYRLILDTMARMLANGRVTEAVPLQWIGERLGLHRNAVSTAYEALAHTGLVRRTAVKHRGAPTRTTLIGPSAKVVLALSNMPTGTTAIPREPTQDQPPTIVQRSEPEKPIQAENEKPDHVQEIARPRSDKPVDVDRLMELARSIPQQAQDLARSHIGAPETLAIDPQWNLSAEQIAFLRKLVEPENKAPVTNSSPRVLAAPETAASHIATALIQALPALERVTGCASRAGQVADEIAFMVQSGRLGRGDPLAGVRAGISIVARGTWRRPIGFHNAWRGAVERAVRVHGQSDDARKSVH